jgi:hypothetical protein
MWNARLIAGAVATGGLAFSAAGQAAELSASRSDIAKVWAQEDNYWRAVQQNRVDDYRSLFSSEFRGWPCDDPGTRKKSELSMTAIQATGGSVAIERQGQASRPGVVIVYYRTRATTNEADGSSKVIIRNFTHTWMEDRGRWTIVGGMCRVEAPPKK